MFINCFLKMFSINCMFITSGTCNQIFQHFLLVIYCFYFVQKKNSGILFIPQPFDSCISGETWRPIKAVGYCTRLWIERCRDEHSTVVSYCNFLCKCILNVSV